MKRILALVLLIVIVFAGCSAEKKKSEKAEGNISTSVHNITSETKAENASQTEDKSKTAASSGNTTVKQLPKIEKGKVENKNYINKSLGFKIVLPEKWEYYSEEEMDKETPELSKYGDKNQVYFISKTTEIPTGYDIKSVSVSVALKSGYKSLDDYKIFVKESYNDDPDYMHTEDKGIQKIGNRNYWHVKFVYPTVDYVYSDLFVCYEKGSMITIHFSQLDDKEIESFIKNDIVNI